MDRAVLFDLDDTLVVEEAAAVAAFEAAARFASGEHPVDVAELATGARARARDLWRASPAHGYCLSVGLSSWEGLWCRFEGDEPQVRALRDWSPTYRREAWRLALTDQGVDDVKLAEKLGERFAAERRVRHQLFPDVAPVLSELSGAYGLALVTNGASCLQREKVAASGVSDYFDVVVVSGDFGVGKPDAAIFRHALLKLGSDEVRAVMVGDSLSRDIDGALDAGLGGVLVNRFGRARLEARPGLVEIATMIDRVPALTQFA